MASEGVGLAASFRPGKGGGVAIMVCALEGFGVAATPAVEGASFLVRLLGTAPDSVGADFLSQRSESVLPVGGDS